MKPSAFMAAAGNASMKALAVIPAKAGIHFDFQDAAGAKEPLNNSL